MKKNSQQLKAKVENKSQVTTSVKVSFNPFQKTDKERSILRKLKKEHNKKFQNLFGSKRPTAGVVHKHFLNP